MGAPNRERIPTAVLDSSLALEAWWREQRCRTARRKPFAIRVQASDGRWYWSSRSRPLLAGGLVPKVKREVVG
jgi:hypothetical protein